MATTYYGAMREPFANEAPPPSRCAKCNSVELARAYHRDLIDCVIALDNNELMSAFCSGEHTHWLCTECGDDFTSPCADGDDE